MNKQNTDYYNLIRLLFCNNKKLFLLSMIASIIGFTFLFLVTSLSNTIVRSREDATIRNYGKFLMVISDINKDNIEKVKEQNKNFDFESFEVGGNIEYNNNIITLGAMEEHMGDNLGFQLLYGKWPENSNQIAVEEYLTYLFNIDDKQLPVEVSLIKDGQPINYEITAVISNYSCLLSSAPHSTLDTNVYPSIIFQKGRLKHVNESLVILQNKLDFKSSSDDINAILNNCFEHNQNFDNISINERLYSMGYQRNVDIAQTKNMYLVLLNILLIVEQVIMMRVILMRNRKTLFLFQAMGSSSKQNQKVILYSITITIIIALFLGGVNTILLGLVYFGRNNLEYYKYYFTVLIHNVVNEGIIVGTMIICSYFACWKNRKVSIIKGMIEDTVNKRSKYKYKKIDICVVVMQTICLFFIIASINFVHMFQLEQGDINYDLYSKRTKVSYPLKGYNIAAYDEKYFPFSSVELFDEYENDIKISMEADTKLSTIIIPKDAPNDFFSDYCYNDNNKLKNEDRELWNQLSEEDQEYKVVDSGFVNVTVLKERDYNQVLQKGGLEKESFADESECILILPNNGKASDNTYINEKGHIQLGRIQEDENRIELIKEAFKVVKIIRCEPEESNQIQVIMSENVAKKSKIVVGYDKISITMNAKTNESIKKDIDQLIFTLMASIQGGMLDSSVLRNKENMLMNKYTSIMSNTMIVFCMGVIFIYIIFNSYIEWEKNRYEYAILRSFGMSYSRLQHMLFVKYNYSILFASIVSIMIGGIAFPNINITQIILSLLLIVSFMYLSKGMVYYRNRNKSISSMLISD